MAVYSLLSSPPRPFLARHATRCGIICAICAFFLILTPAVTLYGGAYYSNIATAASRPFASSKEKAADYLATTAMQDVTPSVEPDIAQPRRDEYVAICLAVRDQGPDLQEFLHHHYYNIGVRRFYIMDDGSRPPLSSLGAGDAYYGVPSAALTFVYYDEAARVHDMQHKVYDDCVHVWGANHTWMAFIDTDEFLDVLGASPSPSPAVSSSSSLLSYLWPSSSSPKQAPQDQPRNGTTKGNEGKSETLESILRELEPLPHVGALGVNWQLHTSNGRLTRAASVRAAYTECIYDDPAHQGAGSDNRHIKSIVRVRDYDRPLNPHKFALKQPPHPQPEKVTVGEHNDTVVHFAFRQPITRDRLSLHHYAVKSRQEYEEKIMRSNAMSTPKGEGFWNPNPAEMGESRLTKRLFADVEHELPHVECKDMLRWIQ
ncbi:hypothetical protein PG999_006386 [Apiospora kogelbergensis]|uniref:Glycosyltransferase family 92 protein n=1 Tax=Apiospora kogelbergensis TaxID=1337665 RepID=A0AAW0QRC6_9PEZI